MKDAPPTVHVTLNIPAALKTHLQDEAAAHGRSLNEHILQVLIGTPPKRTPRTTRQKLMELEPGTDDPRTDQEIARQMEAVNPYRGSPPPTANGYHANEVDGLDVDAEISWMNPEHSFFTER